MKRTVLITGCSKGGIGDALAQEFHSNGVRVFATARDITKMADLKAMGIEVLPLDVVSADSIQAAVSIVNEATGGKLDFLVNSAGKEYVMPVIDSDLATAKEIFDVNVFGLVAVTQACSPMLVAAKGKVINMSSVKSRAAIPFTGMYNATKAAVTSISDVMRIELEPFGVQVITVVAGRVNSGLFANQITAELPQNSLYKPISTEISEAGSEAHYSAISPKVFATRVVANVMKRDPKKYFWYGTDSTIVWLFTTLLPHTFMDSVLAKQVKLHLLKERAGDSRPKAPK